MEETGRELPFRDRIDAAALREIFDHWMHARGDKPYPGQRDIDLARIPKHAPNCFILDVVEPRRFRYRYMGTDIDSHLGANVTGKMLHEFRSGGILETLTEFFGTVAERGRPGFLIDRVKAPSGNIIVYRRVVMPLSDDGERINKLFGGWVYEFDDRVSFFARSGKGKGSDHVDTRVMIFDET